MSDSKNRGFQLPKPGHQHQLLEPFVGRFRADVELYMGPGDPQKSSGTMTNSWQLDGLYLHQDYVGDPPPPPYSAFVGRGYWGFNFGKNHYEGFWIDNVSSIMQMETGTVDESGKVFTMTSELDHPSGVRMKKRSLIRVEDQDYNWIDSFLTGPDGREFRTMTIRYTRA